MSKRNDHHRDRETAIVTDDERWPWSSALDRTGRGWTGLHDLLGLARSSTPWESAREGLDQISRRGLFKLLGASAAMASLAACSSRPSREIRPYAHQPPELTPGVPQHYATALVEDGFATGVLVESHEGRPTKIEGNPDHPASLGATRAIEQAAVLSLYDPQRARSITDRGAPAAWSEVEQFIRDAGARRGAGLRLVLEPTSSPLIAELVGRIRTTLPAATITFWSPFSLRTSIAGNRIAFGRAAQTQLDLRTADVIVALDADLVGDHPMALAYTRQISDRRRVIDGGSSMNRLYVIESAYTTTGTIADHRFRVRGSEIERVALELLADLVHQGRTPARAHDVLSKLPRASGTRERWIAAIARDLVRTAGRSVVVAGERQPAVVHAIVAAINAALGNHGNSVAVTEPVVFEAGQPSHDLAELARALDRGEVSSLISVGGNPVYTAPAELELGRSIARVPNSLYVGLYANETAQACRYVAPALHTLEEWGIARAYDGSLTPIQPLIEPLFAGRSTAEILLALLGDSPASERDRTAAVWRRLFPDHDFEASLALGAVAGSAAPPLAVELAWDSLAPALVGAGARPAPPLELDLRPHPMVHDGRYTNNPWLLELPEPITKLTWDNAAQVSPRTAARLELGDGDIVALTVAGRTIDVPAIVVPGHADDSITLHAGFGRDGEEHIARGIGANAFRLWTLEAGLQPAVAAVARGGHRDLAVTQEHWRMEGRAIALSGTLTQLGEDPAFRADLASRRGAPPSLNSRFPAAGAQWAMSIDLTTCTGCTACVMACAAENNSPVVGRTQVLNSREMHWIRIDRYFDGTPDEPTVAMQPMTCQHCEAAPCEYVCPVEATTHSPDGLNEMAYNRCVGTRFCSNNCPYKVRRFNWFDFKQHDGLQILARNPDVTIRERGVMEKCTYCVQRIRRVEIDARVADRAIGSAEVRTACQQACPAQAIAFGSITDPASTVTEHRARPHGYAVLHDQGTVPRTMYLARIRNVNPELG